VRTGQPSRNLYQYLAGGRAVPLLDCRADLVSPHIFSMASHQAVALDEHHVITGLGSDQHAATAMAVGDSHDDPFSASAWESHRTTITDLYQTKNLPLKQVMQYLRSRHGFKATLVHILRSTMDKEED
jgi:hypothetical protein